MSWRGMTWLKIIVVLVLIFVVGSSQISPKFRIFKYDRLHLLNILLILHLPHFLYTHPIWMAIMISILSLLNVLSWN